MAGIINPVCPASVSHLLVSAHRCMNCTIANEEEKQRLNQLFISIYEIIVA
jgi:hypothetical protein